MRELIFTNNYFAEKAYEITDCDLGFDDDLMVENNLENLKYDVERLIEKNGWLVAVGTIGTWHGNVPSGKIIRTFEDLTNLMFGRCSDCYVNLYLNDEGTMSVQTAHHDGTNYFTIKQLNGKGMQFVENRFLDFNDLNHVFDKYTRKRKIVFA